MFEFSQEHEMMRTMVRRWATEVLEPKVDAIEGGEAPYDLMRQMVKTFGIADLAKTAAAKRKQKREAGGDEDGGKMRGGLASQDHVMSAILSLELSRVCPGYMLAFGASMGLCGGAIMARGTDKQRDEYGVPVLSFDKIGAWGMTEPGAGSDAFRSMRTVARRDGDHFIINGQKTFITNAPFADVLLVYAKVDNGDGAEPASRPIEAFVIEKGDPGLDVSAPMRKMGMHASPTGEIFLSDCRVPADRLLGGEQRASGRAGGRDVFHSERTGMAPMCVGIIERCLEVSLSYATERKTWGKAIAEYQLVQQKLAGMFVQLQNCKNLMFKQLTLQSEGKSMTAAEASATKLYCARAATDAALEAIQILGGNGYMQEYRVEMLMRDAKLLQIGGGTDEIQILHIARDLLKDVR